MKAAGFSAETIILCSLSFGGSSLMSPVFFCLRKSLYANIKSSGGAKAALASLESLAFFGGPNGGAPSVYMMESRFGGSGALWLRASEESGAMRSRRRSESLHAVIPNTSRSKFWQQCLQKGAVILRLLPRDLQLISPLPEI